MRCLIVTRPRAAGAAWVAALRERGLSAAALPLIEIAAVADAAPLAAAWRTLPQRALAVFVSANAVERFVAASPVAPATPASPATAAWPAGVLAGSTGPGTSAALRAAGVPDAALVEPAPDAAASDSEALWERLAGCDWTGRSVLVVRGEGGRDWLATELRGRGASVEFIAAYRRLPPAPTADEATLLAAARAEPRGHAWLFSSSEAIGHLAALAPDADWSVAVAIATHPRIAATASAAGFGRVVTAAPTLPAVAAAVAAVAA